MREIKFRAWDKENTKMIRGNHCVEFDGSVHEYSLGCVIENKNLILMQFTGLLDKNGKEIFEGDIVEGLEGINLNGYIQKIDFKDGVFGVSGMGLNEGFCEFNWTVDTIKIIGNIYENSELLK